MASADDYVTLYGPWAGPAGLTVPVAALTLLLDLSMRGFDFRTTEDGKLLVSPPRDDEGQAIVLTSDERALITRYKLHLISLAVACDPDAKIS